jgi:3-hydroxyisobutyrate dehydrogenase-like beta-hydroxyacid dehydrogenase
MEVSKQPVGILHPGAMGISIAAALQESGHAVHWVSAGRSNDSRKRAKQYNLIDSGSLAELCSICPVIISVCPPHAAETVADDVLAQGFQGMYIDANAISPLRTERIARKMLDAGVVFVDGGIIGPPAWEPEQTWLYLSGQEAAQAALLFERGLLETEVIGPEIGKASALKMCFAANTKGTTALLCAVLGAAESLGVRTDLERQWSRHGSDFADQTRNRARRVTAKAWRFAGEMEEIAQTFEVAGLPGGFHMAAYEVYTRLAHFKDAADVPALVEVLAALQDKGQRE